MVETKGQVRYRVRQWGGWWYAERHNVNGWQHVYCNPNEDRVIEFVAFVQPEKVQ